MDVEGWFSALSLERVTVVGLLVVLLALFATGVVLSRRSADREKEALVRGYAAKDEAHAEVVAYKDERIADLTEQVERRDTLLERRERQLGQVLDEVAPSLVAWAQAGLAATAELASGEGGGESVAEEPAQE